MKINEKRLICDLKDFSKLTDTPGNGVTRFSYGEKDKQARKLIEKIANDFSFDVEVDYIGNMKITPPGSNGKIIIGSHIDTVRNGGRLDGIYGVISGMEILRTLAEKKKSHNVALMVYAEEEGSVFGSTMTGSKFLSGAYKEVNLDSLKDDEGKTMREYLDQCKFARPKDNYKLNFKDVDLMLELHIEQGPVLDEGGCKLGIVNTVFGMKVLEITFEGIGNHAGASPMEMRHDPLNAMAESAMAIEKIIMAEIHRKAVATIGKVKVLPDCSNVIPNKVTFTVDIRSSQNTIIDLALDDIKGCVKGIANKRGVDCTIKEIADSKAIPLSKDIIERMKQLAEKGKIKYRVMGSGAVHDTAMMAGLTKTGMVFVPSIKGRSHVPEEDTKDKDLACGTQFLMDFVEDIISG